MRTAAIYIASFVLSMIAALPGSVYAQTAQPAVASLETTPIGKIVSANGVVTVQDRHPVGDDGDTRHHSPRRDLR